MITVMGIWMIIVMVVVTIIVMVVLMMLISTHWNFDSNLKDLGGCMIGVRFLLVDAGIMDAMVWFGLEKHVGGC